MPATAERPPFVWFKLHTQVSFCKLPLGDHVDVADLAAAAGARCGVGPASLELFLAAPPSAQPPLPAAIAAALLCDPLPVYANLLDAGIAPGAWLLARVTADALSAAQAGRAAAEAALATAEAARATAEASAAWEREARLAAKALADKEAFLALMLSISSAGSGDTASHADEARRGAPMPQSAPLEEVLGALPAPDPFDASLAWRAFAAAHERMPRMPRPSRSRLDENSACTPPSGRS
jgi:hypothetical protein